MPGFHIQPQYYASSPSASYACPPTPMPSYIPLPQVPMYGSSSSIAGSYGATYIPLPAVPSKINDVLAPTQRRSFTFNVTRPSEIVFHDSQYIHQRSIEPATTPPMPILIIEFPGIPQWQIVVRPSTHQYVTVADVLKQIYESLRAKVGKQEHDMLCASGVADSVSVTNAFYRRVKQQSSRELQDGTRRVDFLGSRVTFGGLAATHRASMSRTPEVWQLIVS